MSKKNAKAKSTLCDGVNNMSTVELDTEDADGFHGQSYKDFQKALSGTTDTLTGSKISSPNCECEQVTTYGMVCVNCGKPYQIKTRWTTDGGINYD